MPDHYGPISPEALGLIMKEVLRRGLQMARSMITSFEATEKKTAGKDLDWFTTADTEAQRVMAKSIRECFPGFGILGEEAGLRVPCTIDQRRLRITIDPIDGTKAYIRGQSHGVGTMIAVAEDDEIVAAFVGDVMTQEVYYYRPCSPKTHRLRAWDMPELLEIDTNRKLADQYLLLRNRESKHSPHARRIFAPPEAGGKFQNIEITGGSIGISMARLWKGEVGGTILLPCMENPWDYWPILGISKHLGFRYFKIEDGKITPYEMPIRDEPWQRDFELLIVHGSRQEELLV